MINTSFDTGLLQFQEKLSVCLSGHLPGIEAQLTMAPAGRVMEIFSHNERNPVLSSVLILLYLKNGHLYTIFIRRPVYPGIHSGQIAFPGGRQEPDDHNHMETALRETHEEIGISADRITVAGRLTPLYIPPSNYMVYPFVGITQPDPEFRPDPSEVAEIVEIPLNELMNPGTVRHLPPSPEFKFLEVPAFVIGKNTIWGATAMILAELLELFSKNEQLINLYQLRD